MNSPDTSLKTMTPMRALMENDTYTKSMVESVKFDLLHNEGGETGHMEADQSLCKLLVALGFQDVVDLYNAISPKWYA